MENGRFEWGDEESEGDQESMHVLYKIPPGEGPYARAKHLQLVDKDLDASIPWFWKAVNSGDRIDSALKDMAVVMKQRERSEEAIEAIKSFRHLCSKQAQESLDNLLIDLYKKCGRTKEEIELLKRKLRKIYMGEAFHGKTTKKARSHGKKIQVSIKQETSRVLGNLAWAYMQQHSYIAAEAVYRKAQMIDPDANKACNLSLCLIEQGRLKEARQILSDVLERKYVTYSDSKLFKRAQELISRIDSQTKFLIWDKNEEPVNDETKMEDDMIQMLDMVIKQWAPFRSKRLPIFEEISAFRDPLAC
ncbi:Tetratricopeptide repeat (TPR)-like superfamily protein [Rhynchospora pubera]|uniref:Tetratricopeptide repeat (TPR)-like superfamily protein n=1 Tax=Rhynchospora pubera TaxID=906938 RepID=A0AAV8HYG0_9POAL|nr:Tetratricopeptide repeat (TPR)-like superfamily protein [Rhynchospora pubera]KAJ4820247.1 Tetratricopeptide repeat (TPR)-like superfamily protein [Rhynchospora pubera]